MPAVADESVLVVPTGRFLQLGHFQGFCSAVERYLPALLEGGELSYRPRRLMEQDPSFKQLIPYVLFRYRDDRQTSLFQYTRGGGQGESRLHAKRSVGVGGHISTQDVGGAGDHHADYREGMLRELAEEVAVDTAYSEQCVGLINDDQSPVGKVHLGVVHVCDVDRPNILPREADLLEAGFRPIQQIVSDLDRFETWSQIAVKAIVDHGVAAGDSSA